jgi:predicted RNA-binding Zn ribbon-like protein
MIREKPYQFGRIGGALCLDFTNTASWEADRQTTELLNDFPDLVRWCTEAALLHRDSAVTLVEEREENTAEAAVILAKAKDLRATLYRIFMAVSRRKFPASRDLQLLNETLNQTPLRLQVRREKNQFLSERKAVGTKFAKLLGPVVWSALELLTSAEIDQVKCCASETCGWLFLDNTKNHSRRWCDMADCGSHAKAKRYYRKKLSASARVEEGRNQVPGEARVAAK